MYGAIAVLMSIIFASKSLIKFQQYISSSQRYNEMMIYIKIT